MAKRETKVYDWPTRIFHWSFIFFFAFAYGVAETVSDESIKFRYHMLSGLMLGLVVLFRIVWGFVGTTHARFLNFELHPKNLLHYFKSLLKGGTKSYAGHNPASSWAGLAMILLSCGIVITGIMMGWNKEAYSELHEVFINLTLLVAIGHVMGLLFHMITHKDSLGLSMIDGKKAVDTKEAIRSDHKLAAVILVVLIIAQATQISKSLDLQQGKVTIWGVTLQLGENEEQDKD